MLNNTLQINYWTIGGFEGEKPVEQAIEEASGMGFDGVELTFGTGEFAPGISKKRCEEIRAMADVSDMTLKSVATGVHWDKALSAEDEKERKEAIEFTREYLRVAGWLGAGVALVIPGYVAVPWDDSRPVTPYQECWDNATDSLKQCLSAAEKSGVVMALENVWNWFLADPVAMRTFVDQFDSDYVGVYFDVANCVINGFPEHWIPVLGDRIAAMHFKNFERQDCGGVLHGFGDDILKGDVNWEAVVRAIEKIDFQGPITAEMVPFSRLPDLKLPDMEMAKDTASKMRKIAGRE
jgi:hexulose-6-phosphate isomerase